MDNQKLWYTSKTIWVNALALVAAILASTNGYELTPETQATILVVINFILRFITKEEIIWSAKK